jgi:hypothetical protein
MAGRWEGYLSLVFASLLCVAAVAVYLLRWEVSVLPQLSTLRVCVRVGPLRFADRRVPFTAVHGVRVTLGPRASRDDSVIEILCAGRGGDVCCPPTNVPREQGLLLAMMLRTPLIKAWEEGPSSDLAGPATSAAEGGAAPAAVHFGSPRLKPPLQEHG